MSRLYLQNCEPFWGYDCRTGLFIPINYAGKLRTTPHVRKVQTFHCFNKKKPFRSDLFLNYDDIACWIINENPNVYKFTEFYFANYQTCEFAFKIQCVAREIKAFESNNYPSEATHFVKGIVYGMEMWIFLNQKNISLFDKYEQGEFWDKVWKGEEKLTKEQKNAECSVLIFAKNPEETTVKQMKLSEVLQFCDDFKNEKYPKYEAIILCIISGLRGKKSFDDFKLFNGNVQNRKEFEISEEYVKLLHLLEKFLSKLWNPENSSNCKTRKNLTEKEQQTDAILGDANQMDSQTIIMDKNSLYSMKPKILRSLTMPITLLNDVEKPYVWNKHFGKKMLLGLVSHVNQPTAEVTETNEMFVMRCPKKCSNDDRQWICTTCGLFFKVNGFDVVCDCGVANISDLSFECFEPTHLKTFTVWQTHILPAKFSAEQRTMLNVIKQQLEKIVKKDGMTTNNKLSSVIQSIDNPDVSILDQLETLDFITLDGDTVNLINKFLCFSK